MPAQLRQMATGVGLRALQVSKQCNRLEGQVWLQNWNVAAADNEGGTECPLDNDGCRRREVLSAQSLFPVTYLDVCPGASQFQDSPGNSHGDSPGLVSASKAGVVSEHDEPKEEEKDEGKEAPLLMADDDTCSPSCTRPAKRQKTSGRSSNAHHKTVPLGNTTKLSDMDIGAPESASLWDSISVQMSDLL
ncbi:hypothetical protein NDU88_005409 [Pleurodeles waltl]|uniref:Uncharacterized protein n=1 Tax=Pleurodeles waltl TaxID=8319 RepID=A0AAV7UHZ1_PLEWA|nr:hypothetical protein NDU88_005409 [Pleurodeles waltl]